jgi:hypothetical protein
MIVKRTLIEATHSFRRRLFEMKMELLKPMEIKVKRARLPFAQRISLQPFHRFTA